MFWLSTLLLVDNLSAMAKRISRSLIQQNAIYYASEHKPRCQMVRRALGL